MHEKNSALETRYHSRHESWRRFVDTYGPIVYRWLREFGISKQVAATIGSNIFRQLHNEFTASQRTATLDRCHEIVLQTAAAHFEKQGATLPDTIASSTQTGKSDNDVQSDREELVQRALKSVGSRTPKDTFGKITAYVAQCGNRKPIEGGRPTDLTTQLRAAQLLLAVENVIGSDSNG